MQLRTIYLGILQGGQILHRYALFNQTIKSNRITAANSGWFTLPDASISLPYGIKNTTIDQQSLVNSYSKKLMILIGDQDNAPETRSILLQTKLANQHGAHSLERAHYFYNYNQELSQKIKSDFIWKLKVVEGVGYDYRKMSDAAAKLLYD